MAYEARWTWLDLEALIRRGLRFASDLELAKAGDLVRRAMEYHGSAPTSMVHNERVERERAAEAAHLVEAEVEFRRIKERWPE